MESLRDLLKNSVKDYGVSLSDSDCEAFERYSLLLREWNEKMNLTAITEEREIVIKHFSDSLSIVPYLPKDRLENGDLSVIDVGTGAGFPGIPLKITFPRISLTLIDSLEKRIKFLNEVLSQVEASDYKCVHARAEDAGHNTEYREKYDICTARAVARLPILLEYCLPFVKVGGLFVAMKGSDIQEIEESKEALNSLGGEIIAKKSFNLFNSDIKRNVILIRKNRQTSTKYPRKSNVIAKLNKK